MKFFVRNFPQVSPAETDLISFQIIAALVAAVSAEAQYLSAAFPYAGLAGAFPYAGIAGGYAGVAGGFPYAAGLGYTAAAAAVPFGSSSGLDPITQGLDAVTQGVVAPYGHYYGKRAAEAEPEAEPQYLAYGGLGYTGYAGHAGLPYSSYAGYPYSGLGYSAYHLPASYAAPLSACRNYVGAPVPC